MGRPKEFDEATVLTRAMTVFRAGGYSATSMRDLEREVGLTIGSLYNEFGGKAGLFARALAHYNHVVVRGRLTRYLVGRAPPRDEVEALFASTFDGSQCDMLGCLLTTASSEAHALSSEAKALLEEGVDAQKKAFAQALERVPHLDAKERAERAEVLLAAYHGLLVMVRQGQPKRMLRAMTQATMNVVFPE